MTQENINEIRLKMNIVDVVQDYVKLKKQGSNLVGLCPFHTEKTGSFSVSPAKQIYKCFGCGKSGDAIQFLIEHEKKNFSEAMELLAIKYNIQVTEATRKKEFIKPTPRLEKISKEFIEWFEKRKISNDTLIRMKITEATEWMPQFQKEVRTVCFNYFRKEELVNIKFRGPQKSFKLAKDAELIFYNIDSIVGEEDAVIVEGEIDCLSMYEAKIYNCISVPNGAAKGSQKLEYLDNCWESFIKLKKVIIAVDNDEPGRMLKEELARRIGKEKCWTIEYPEGCKDANDVLVKHGPGALSLMIEHAKEWPLEGIMPMEEIFPTVYDWYHEGYPAGAKCGIYGIDHMIRFPAGVITTITGIPGHGKDEFFNWILACLAKNQQWEIAVCGFEETPMESVTKIAEKLTGKAFDFRKDPNDRMSYREFENAIAIIDRCFHFYNTDECETSIDGILKIAIQLVLRYGILALYLNPWNWIEHNREPGQSETEYVSLVYSKIIRFARKYGVHVFLIAHTTKMLKDKQTKKYEVPTLYNISGSANFYNKTHYGITIYRDFETGIVTIYFQKIKQSWMGQVGWSSFSYNTMTRQYNFIESSVSPENDARFNSSPFGNWKPIHNFYEQEKNTNHE
jgi:twinkle protein